MDKDLSASFETHSAKKETELSPEFRRRRSPINESTDSGDVELEEIAQDVKNIEERKTIGVNEALDMMGFGKFQWILLVICGCIYISDSMEIMILSFLSRTLKCEWDLEEWEEASISTGVFVGMMIGSIFWGMVSDAYGRRIALLFIIIWTILFSLVSASSPNYLAMLAFRSLLGFGISGLHVAWYFTSTLESISLILRTIFLEYTPNSARNWSLGLTSIFWSIGTIFESFLAWIILPTLGWRWLLIISAIPFCISLIGIPFFPESTLFLRTKSKFQEIEAIFRRIASWNSKDVEMSNIDFEENSTIGELEKKGSFLDIFSPDLRLSSALLFFIWFSVSFTYYGVVLLVANFSKSRCYSSTLSNFTNNTTFGNMTTNGTNCGSLFTNEDYIEILIVSASEFPGLILTVTLLEYVGRKKTLFVTFFICGACAALLNICFSPIYDTILMFIIRMTVSGAYQAIYVYTPEVYPTHVRSTAFGLCSVFARLGGTITPFVALTLGDKHPDMALLIYAFCMLTAAAATFLLPFETQGINLGEAFVGKVEKIFQLQLQDNIENDTDSTKSEDENSDIISDSL